MESEGQIIWIFLEALKNTDVIPYAEWLKMGQSVRKSWKTEGQENHTDKAAASPWVHVTVDTVLFICLTSGNSSARN